MAHPEHDWLPWKFKLVPSSYWREKANQRRYLDWLARELNYSSRDDWCGGNLTHAHFSFWSDSSFAGITSTPKPSRVTMARLCWSLSTRGRRARSSQRFTMITGSYHGCSSPFLETSMTVRAIFAQWSIGSKRRKELSKTRSSRNIISAKTAPAVSFASSTSRRGLSSKLLAAMVGHLGNRVCFGIPLKIKELLWTTWRTP